MNGTNLGEFNNFTGLLRSLEKKFLEKRNDEKFWMEKEKDEYIEELQRENYILRRRLRNDKQNNQYNGYIGRGFGFKNTTKVVCYNCNKPGHIAPKCPEFINMHNNSYTTFNGNFKKIKICITPLTIKKILQIFKNEFKKINYINKFCTIEKCEIKTTTEKIINEKPYSIPQALKEKALKYI
ncbi:hypothetical protein GVAV_002769 [Gurleya vavrai]